MTSQEKAFKDSITIVCILVKNPTILLVNSDEHNVSHRYELPARAWDLGKIDIERFALDLAGRNWDLVPLFLYFWIAGHGIGTLLLFGGIANHELGTWDPELTPVSICGYILKYWWQ